jgi:Relaxase/Mobilisation nuclease domain
MIGNQTKGKSFRGLLDYLENKEQSSLIGGNMFGTNARELAREFRLSRQLNPEAEKVVHHVSLSLSPDEQLDNDTWCEIADKYMNAMGYTANQYAIYRHSDRDHDHIHICASRISLDDGKITRDSWEYVRSEKIIRQLELEYGLQQTLSSKEKLNRAPSYGQQRRIEREQLEYEQGLRNTAPQQPIKTQLIEVIDRATVDKPTMPQLMERLQLQGVEIRHGVTRNGKSKGISYSWNDQKFSGTSLGPAYTFPGLQKHKSIDYQPQRDDAKIEQLLNNRVGRTVVNLELINAIYDFIKQSAVESTLAESLPEFIEQLSQNQAQTQTTDKPKLTPNLRAELYKYYSAEKHNLLVTDRDKEIALRALLDNQPVQDVEEIILASPAGWTADEAKALVRIAKNQLASKQEQPEQQLSSKQQLQSEYLAIAVPVAVELINWQLRETGNNSFRFKRATLEKLGRELVFTHDERGEVFRVKVNRNQLGELEYSPTHVGEVNFEDTQFWQSCERLLQEIIESEQQQKLKSSKGFSR